MNDAFIIPDWPRPKNVRCLITTKYAPDQSHASNSVYGAFNLALHVDDDQNTVTKNRQQLISYANLPAMPVWQTQVHGTQVQVLGKTHFLEADACYTNQTGYVGVMLTADCLPIFVADVAGKEVAVIHAGWRGLLEGVIENTLTHFESKNTIVYLGPAISQENYIVGEEVYQAFIEHDSQSKVAFLPDVDEVNKYKMDLVQLAKLRLAKLKVMGIYGGDYCTYADQRFYSYRQACHQGNADTGRMASLIWLCE